MADAREFRIGAEHVGERLDRFVASELGLSRGYVRRLLRLGRVHVASGAALKGGLLHAGDQVRIDAFRHPDEGPIAAQHCGLRLLAQQDGLLAFEKPAGMATHPLDFEEEDTALNAVLALHPELVGIGDGGLRSGVVHRLDTDTSGVLVFASEERAWRRARAAFAERAVEKRYLAWVHGNPEAGRELSLRLDHRGPRMRVVSRGGREGVLRIGAVHARGDGALVEIELVTGLMHQVRASLAHLGHPVVGDRLYGSTAETPRHWLHATAIRIGEFEARSEPPAELRWTSG